VTRALAIVAAFACALAVFFVREATMSRPSPKDPSSRMDIVLRARPHNDRMDVSATTEALVRMCLLEAHGTRLEGEGRRVGELTWSFRIRPALEGTNQLQVHGCLEDAILDRYQAKVVEMRRL
jgi:hypothetical protein